MARPPIPFRPTRSTGARAAACEFWNENLLRETLEAASKNDPNRSAVQQKIGDYWAACMDESRHRSLRPEAAAAGTRSHRRAEIEERHHARNRAPAPHVSRSVAVRRQPDRRSRFSASPDNRITTTRPRWSRRSTRRGLSLPNRDYYLKTDDKSKELLTKYRAHIQKMFVLAGESEAQAASDAGTVIELETALAQAQMDNVKRRDPKNINNKMTLAQVRELTPSIDWDEYLKAVKAPASDHYIVTSPDFFRAEEKLINQHPLDHWQAYMRWQVIHRCSALS